MCGTHHVLYGTLESFSLQKSQFTVERLFSAILGLYTVICFYCAPVSIWLVRRAPFSRYVRDLRVVRSTL